MPELPEVEIIKRELDNKVFNKSIKKSYKSDKRLRLPIGDLSSLEGENIQSIYRRNKYIILGTQAHWVLIHLGMTGRLTVEQNDTLKKHTHYMFQLDDNSYIKYEDARRFGLIVLYTKKEFPNYKEIPLLINLGIEPFESEFTAKEIYNLSRKKKIAVKKFIMDSNIICGIGNIYASEILFLCNIHPLKVTEELTKLDCDNLYRHTKEVLQRSISLGGSSISDYVHTNGVKGEMQNFYNVYGRYGEECKVCRTIIQKENIGGRTAYFCPTCQHLKETK